MQRTNEMLSMNNNSKMKESPALLFSQMEKGQLMVLQSLKHLVLFNGVFTQSISDLTSARNL